MPLSPEQMKAMEEKKTRILEQAVVLFSELGYNETTIAKVAKASNVSFGSVFTYYKNKDELFHYAIADPLETIKLKMLAFNDDPSNPLEEIESMVTAHVQLFASISKYLRLVQQVIGQNNRFPEQFEILEEFHQVLKGKLMKLIKKGQLMGQLHELDPDFTAVAYSSFLMGLRLNMTDGPHEDIWQHFIPYAILLFGPIK